MGTLIRTALCEAVERLMQCLMSAAAAAAAAAAAQATQRRQ